MAQFSNYVSPLIGTKGIYTLATPFTTSPGEILECLGIRTIADYVANNDDPLNTVYLANKLTEDDYNLDAAANMEIATLRNDKGFQYLVPCKYITAYPIQDGVLYRSIAIVCALPAIHVNQDLTMLDKEIKDVIKANLGVESMLKHVETSQIRGVSGSEDKAIQATRGLIVDDSATIYMTVVEQANEIEALRMKVAKLEAYIIANQ